MCLRLVDSSVCVCGCVCVILCRCVCVCVRLCDCVSLRGLRANACLSVCVCVFVLCGYLWFVCVFVLCNLLRCVCVCDFCCSWLHAFYNQGGLQLYLYQLHEVVPTFEYRFTVLLNCRSHARVL